MQSGSHNPPPHLIPSGIPKLNKEPVRKRLFKKIKILKKIPFTPLTREGTGKTYASAFAAREFEFKKVLFLVHRNQIAKQALKSYRKVFDGKVSMGMVTGRYQHYDADFVFATVQTLSKEETLSRYKRGHWDLIIIDEAHHSSAESYKKIMDYFTPKLWLGMTATPDKRDDNLEGRNIYEIFNHQIAYEIRLQNAMEEDLLCPFHYFGITDLEVIADAGKSTEEKVENFRCNKDNIRRYVTEGGRVIPGASTIHFDEISRKRIFQAIDNANFSDIKLIRENYTNLKNKLGHIPALADFDKYGEMEVLRIFDNNSLVSYYKFLVKYEKEYTIRLSKDEESVIEFVSKKLASGKRIHELEMLKRLLKYQHGIMGLLKKTLQDNYNCSMDDNCAENVVNMMTNVFPTSAAKKTYSQCVFLEKDGSDYRVSKSFEEMLQNEDFYHILEELIDFGISRYKENFSMRYQDTDFVLYQKYTYEDVCRLLNWERNEVPLNIGGYKYDKKTKTFPVFINYDKQENISDTTKYEDHFTSCNRLIAISKSGRSIESEDVQNFLNAKECGIDVQLFVRKNKDDKISKEFYYLGRMTSTGFVKEFIMPNTDKTAVEIEWALDTPVREDIYEYIVNG